LIKFSVIYYYYMDGSVRTYKNESKECGTLLTAFVFYPMWSGFELTFPENRYDFFFRP